MDKLKNNLASIAALIAAVVAIGGGFAKFGEMQTKLDALANTNPERSIEISENSDAIIDNEQAIKILQTEMKLFRAILDEIKLESNNPLSQ